MNKIKLPDLVIGDLVINPPIIQGGMGVKVSTSSLASAVSNEGGLGVIASVGLPDENSAAELGYEKASEIALQKEIRKARLLTKNPIGVNIMVALSNYRNLVNVCVKEGVDIIISGAGIPAKLPVYCKNSKVKLIPIVSSAKVAEFICTNWLKRYNQLPDAFIVEGPLAGGHLGFSFEELNNLENLSLENILLDVIGIVKKFENLNYKISIIAAGGIFDGEDIARFLKLGAKGVQMATRFVCTKECDVSEKYKEAYLNCKKEDIVIIPSPVGMPGRVIKNKFIEKILNGGKADFNCPYKCLKTCDPENVSYCIAKALNNAAEGNMDEGFAMCGANAYKINEMISVKELINKLEEEAIVEFYK